MKYLGTAISFMTFLAFSCVASAGGFPAIGACESITLRTSQGWWLQIRPDGGGAYGFGVLMERIEVREGTFGFMRIYEQAKTAAVEQRGNAEAPYVAVSCFATGAVSAREFYLTDEAWIIDLLRTARRNRITPRNEAEERHHKKIGVYWKKYFRNEQ